MVYIRHEADIFVACRFVRQMSSRQGFDVVATEQLATAVAELARNQLVHATGGTICCRCVNRPGSVGMSVEALDQGPGIANLEKALQDGYSSKNGLGLGLPSAQRLVDEFVIRSSLGQGTLVKIVKWFKPSES